MQLQPTSADYELEVQLHSYSYSLNNESNGDLCEGSSGSTSFECSIKFTFYLRLFESDNSSNCSLGVFKTGVFEIGEFEIDEFEDQYDINNQTIYLGTNLSNSFFYNNSGDWPVSIIILRLGEEEVGVGLNKLCFNFFL